MIHIAIGTKAQFIKMAPIMRRLVQEGVDFNLIDLAQHPEISARLREEFEIKPPDVRLQDIDISTLSQGLKWLSKFFYKGLNKRWLKEKIFKGEGGVCLIHGDTASTLLALYLAKRVGVKVAHIEAGLRSYNYLEPFPEEIIRLIAMRFSDLLFAPSRWAYQNLEKLGLKEKAILLSTNTSMESTFFSLNKQVNLNLNFEKYALITVHRMENIFCRKRLSFVMEVIKKIVKKLPLVFIQHQPTLKQLNKFNFSAELDSLDNLHIEKILSHAHFIHLISRSEFVVTDGGSIQEECYYLDKPCLLLRNLTERIEGLGENVILSKFSERNLDMFLEKYKEFRHKRPLEVKSPAKEIIEVIKKFV